MRYGIFSDVHSNLEALDAVIDAFKKEDINTYLCAGDLVGYAANPNECIERVLGLKPVIVAGNHDGGSAFISVGLFQSMGSRGPVLDSAVFNREEQVAPIILKISLQE